MKISVAIATYNRVSMVRETIAAALGQWRAPAETRAALNDWPERARACDPATCELGRRD